jgi:cation/acetate symporter
MVIVGQPAIRAIDAGGNMAAPLLAEAVGGQAFLGFIAAVAFATILAVVAGLTLAGAAALSHDLWANVVRRGVGREGEELKVARLSTVLLGILAIVLGIAFKGQNVAYMVGLAFAIAASANFPALLLSVFWRRFTTRAAQVSMLGGTASSLLLIYLSPTIQIDILQHTSAPFPLRNPGLVSIPLAFALAIVVSWLWPDPAAEAGFAEVEHRVHIGAEHASDRVS